MSFEMVRPGPLYPFWKMFTPLQDLLCWFFCVLQLIILFIAKYFAYTSQALSMAKITINLHIITYELGQFYLKIIEFWLEV